MPKATKADRAKGFLEVGHNEAGEVIINHPDLKPDADGVGHIIFSADQARHLAQSLAKYAFEAERDAIKRAEAPDA